MKKYYAVVNEEQQGPFTIEELGDKEISASTLIWTEELDDWTEARNIDELKTIFKKSPPPVPKKSEKTYKVEAEIKKKREKLIKPETKVTAAKEIKTNFKFIIYAIIIGIISFPVFYFGIYNVPKYDNIDYSKIRREYDNIDYSKLGRDRIYGEVRIYGVPDELAKGQIWGTNLIAHVRRIVKIRKEKLTQKSITSSFFTLIISAGVFIIIRYISKAVKWVDETSKKEGKPGHSSSS